MDVGRDQHNQPKYLNLLTDFSSKVHVRMKYRRTLCSHYTIYTQDTYPDSTFFMHSYYSSSSHMPWNQWQLKTHKTSCIQLDGSQACSAICRPQSKQTTTNLQTLIIHVLLTSLIELWPLTSVCNVCGPQFKWITTNPHTLIILVLFTSTIES